MPFGKRFEERRDLALHRRLVALVQLHEQRDDAAGIEVRLRDLEELARVERRRALHPRIERVRRDRVELLVRRQQVVPRVVDVDVDLRVVRRRRSCARRSMSTRPAARAARSRRSSRARRRGSIDTAPAVTPAPQPMTSTVFGLLRHQRRQVAEHPLQAHVLRLARRLHLAGVVIVAARRSAARETATDAFTPFADVDDLVTARPRSPCSGRRRRACPAAAARVRTSRPARAPRRRSSRRVGRCTARALGRAGASMSSPDSAETTISTCCDVLAAEPARPAPGSRRASRRSRRPCSRRRRRRPGAPDPRRRAASDASASGKLAPHRIAPAARPRGSARDRAGTGTRHRRDRRIDRPVRQRRRVSMYAAHAIAPHSSSWHQPSATRGRAKLPRRCAEPMLLPMPSRPGTPRGSARTCRPWRRRAATAAASRSPRRASAVMPDSAIAT